MSFTVNLYNHSKKENSTLRPNGTGTQFSCILKESSGLINPVIGLDIGRTSSPAAYNYAYISEFRRYYFIAEWVYDGALWYAHMVCDVLATYKDEIGSSTLYVLRSASASDGSIIDNLYPMKAIPTHAVTPFSTPWHSIIDVGGNIGTGSYIVGVVSDAPSHGSIAYYAIGAGYLMTLCQYLIASFVSADNGFDVNDAAFSLQKNIIDPFDYIKSCVWIPASLSVASHDGTWSDVTIMGINTGAKGYKFGTGTPGFIHDSTTISSIPRHPQASARGSYLNVAPYTEAELFIPPFGLINLDTRVLASASSIVCDYRIDCMNGSGILNVEIAGTSVNRIEAQLGVPIQLSQIRQDIIGSATSIMGAGMSALTGNFLGAAAGIGSAVQAAAPKANTIGSAGGWSDLSGNPGLVQHFYPVTDEDNSHAGRPLMQNRQISSLTGFVMVQDGDVSIAGTQTEASQIKTYLEGGFYYE